MSTSKPTKQSRELSNAFYDDWKRKVVDEAKKRAVAQNVDYDTFKNMVAVAHLKPIQAPKAPKQERLLPSHQYNADGSIPAAHQSEAAAAALALIQLEPLQAASTSGDFTREWRRNCPSPDVKYRYLRLCGPAAMASLFKIEISSELLKEIVAVLESCWQCHAGASEEAQAGEGLHEASFVLELMQALVSTGRFSLTVKLMGSASKKVLESLFLQLEGAIVAASGQQGAVDPAGQASANPAGAFESPDACTDRADANLSLQTLLNLKRDYGL